MTLVTLFVPGFFYTCVCFLTSRTNMFASREKVSQQSKIIAPPPKMASGYLYKKQVTQVQPTRTQPDPQQIQNGEQDEGEEACCDPFMHFLVQCFFFLATLVASQFLFVFRYLAVFVYTPNAKMNFGRNF